METSKTYTYEGYLALGDLTLYEGLLVCEGDLTALNLLARLLEPTEALLAEELALPYNEAERRPVKIKVTVEVGE